MAESGLRGKSENCLGSHLKKTMNRYSPFLNNPRKSFKMLTRRSFMVFNSHSNDLTLIPHKN